MLPKEARAAGNSKTKMVGRFNKIRQVDRCSPKTFQYRRWLANKRMKSLSGLSYLTQLPAAPETESGWPWTEESMHIPRLMPDGSEWPKISIITPSFNQGRFIEETIRSVLLQNYPNLEYIILDGGSTDETLNKIKQYEPFITYWESNKDDGQYWAINKGFSLSSGRIMCWLNSDDMLFPNACYSVASVFKNNKTVKWITGIPAHWTENGKLYQILENNIAYNRYLLAHACYESRAVHWIMQECTFWTRDLWLASGSYLDTHLNYAADFELWLRFAKFAYLYRVNSLLGGNRRHAGQKTATAGLYEKEVQHVIRKRGHLLINALFRTRLIRLLTRAILMIKKDERNIHFDAANMSWKI